MENSKIKIMLSSSIYGFEDNIKQVASYLESLGYDVISSLLGTVKVNPNLSNLDNSIRAVEECDIFLGFIRTYCGTGNIGEKNITFEEIKHAISLDKPYWFMAEHDVMFCRNLFRNGVKPIESGKNVWDVIKPNKKFFNPLCIDMYDYVVKDDVRDIPSRTGNWVQPYHEIGDIIKFVQKQFADVEYIRELVESKKL